MGNLAREAYCTILSESKMDFDEDVDLEQFSQIASGILVNSLENPKVEGPYNLNIVDYPAVKYEILGSINNTRIRYWHVSVDLGSYYHQVLLWSLPSRFEKNQPDFEEVLRSFRSEEP